MGKAHLVRQVAGMRADAEASTAGIQESRNHASGGREAPHRERVKNPTGQAISGRELSRSGKPGAASIK